jgi:hypothetical protein
LGRFDIEDAYFSGKTRSSRITVLIRRENCLKSHFSVKIKNNVLISVDFALTQTSSPCWTYFNIQTNPRRMTMQYILLIYGDEKGWFNLPEDELQKGYQAYMDFSRDISAAGCMVGGSELKPVSTATMVRVKDGKTILTDGPFAETKEQLGGYYIIDVATLDEALAWAAKCPGAWGGSIEVRPLNDTPEPA